MLIIGLCGGSGSGKGTVSAFFAKKGIPSIDTDLVYRDLTSSRTQLVMDLASEFGNDIISKSGSLDRKALAGKVFSDKSGLLLSRLNKITHTSILDETEKRISLFEKQSFNAVIVDAPLLFESKFDEKCDLIIAVIADKDSRIERIVQRDGIDKNAAIRRIDSQISDEVLKQRVDYVIENNGNLLETEQAVNELYKKIFERG